MCRRLVQKNSACQKIALFDVQCQKAKEKNSNTLNHLIPNSRYFRNMDVDTLREICLLLPAVTEDIKWENLVFSVGGKMFCMMPLEQPFRCSFKVSNEEFEEVSASDRFVPAPYLARAQWVLVTNPSKLNKKEWEQYIRQSYELVKKKLTKKTREQLGIQ
jgi:predicted DNA-binding protein (MmcQ/YjbR family)